MLAYLEPEEPSGDECISLEEACESFLCSRRDMGCTPETIRMYEETVGAFVEVRKDKPIDEVSLSGVRKWVHDESLATATRKKRYSKIRAFLRHHSEASLSKDVPVPRVQEKLPVACRPEELEAICGEIRAACTRMRRSGVVSARQLIWRIPVYQFAFLTGLRHSELSRLRWEDVEETRLVLRKQKSGRQQRLPLSVKAQDLLCRLGKSEGYVFRSPSGPSGSRTRSWGARLTRTFAKYRDKAGVRKEVTVRSLRARYITQLAKAGLNAVAIKRLARHSDIKTSLRYIEAAGESFRDELDEAFHTH